MTVKSISVFVPPFRSEPRFAPLVADALSWLTGSEGGFRTGLAMRLAGLRAGFAVSQRHRRDARARSDLVAMARRYESSQPEFAKDLFAAAGNHRPG